MTNKSFLTAVSIVLLSGSIISVGAYEKASTNLSNPTQVQLSSEEQAQLEANLLLVYQLISEVVTTKEDGSYEIDHQQLVDRYGETNAQILSEDLHVIIEYTRQYVSSQNEQKGRSRRRKRSLSGCENQAQKYQAKDFLGSVNRGASILGGEIIRAGYEAVHDGVVKTKSFLGTIVSNASKEVVGEELECNSSNVIHSTFNFLGDGLKAVGDGINEFGKEVKRRLGWK